MRKITIISIFCLLTSIEVSAGIDQDQLKNSALEFVRAELKVESILMGRIIVYLKINMSLIKLDKMSMRS